MYFETHLNEFESLFDKYYTANYLQHSNAPSNLGSIRFQTDRETDRLYITPSVLSLVLEVDGLGLRELRQPDVAQAERSRLRRLTYGSYGVSGTNMIPLGMI